jgi:hypothetical protein
MFPASVRCSSNETEANKKRQATWVICSNSFNCTVKTSMCQNINGSETNLLPKASPDKPLTNNINSYTHTHTHTHMLRQFLDKHFWCVQTSSVLAVAYKDHPSLSGKAIKLLLPFVTTYLCETDCLLLLSWKQNTDCDQYKKRFYELPVDHWHHDLVNYAPKEKLIHRIQQTRETCFP